MWATPLLAYYRNLRDTVKELVKYREKAGDTGRNAKAWTPNTIENLNVTR